MTPFQLLRKAYRNERLTREEAEDTINEYIVSLRHKNYYLPKRSTPKFSAREYERTFLMLGVFSIYHTEVNKNLLRAAAKAFPNKVIEGVKTVDHYAKIDLITDFFQLCIIPLLFPGGERHYRSEGGKPNDNTGQYGFIPSGMDYLTEMYLRKEDYLYKGERFIDIGCGIGSKTLFVHMLQLPLEGHGIEYDYINAQFGEKALAKLASIVSYCKFCGKIADSTPLDGLVCQTKGCKNSKGRTRFFMKKAYITAKDAFDHSFSEFDRIYTYSPISNFDYLKKFYHHIWSTVRSNTVWFEVATVQQCMEAGKDYGVVQKGKYLIKPKK